MAYWSFSLKNNKKPLRGLTHPEAAKEQILKAVKQAPAAIVPQKRRERNRKGLHMKDFTPPRMETIKTTAALFNLPVHFIRQKVTNGEIVAVRAGRRFLVNVDKLAEYLNSSKLTPETDEAASTSRISPVDLRR